MSHDQAAIEAACPPPPPRVLALDTRAAASLLAPVLEAAGCEVDTVASPSELAAALGRQTYDAVVLDLSTPGMAQLVMDDAGDALSVLGAGKEEPRPAVVAVVAALAMPPSGPGPEAKLGAIVTVTARDANEAARQVEGSVNARRLHHAMEEIVRLRNTVLFARQTAHDLAQPLTTILARAQLLRHNLKADDPHSRAVNIFCDEADRLARMMEEFQKLKVMSRPPSRA